MQILLLVRASILNVHILHPTLIFTSKIIRRQLHLISLDEACAFTVFTVEKACKINVLLVVWFDKCYYHNIITLYFNICVPAPNLKDELFQERSCEHDAISAY